MVRSGDAARPSELERLGDELSRRGLHVTLAPDQNDEAALDVICGHDYNRTVRRVFWRDGSFVWPWGELLDGAGDIGRAADTVHAALQWAAKFRGLVAADDS